MDLPRLVSLRAIPHVYNLDLSVAGGCKISEGLDEMQNNNVQMFRTQDIIAKKFLSVSGCRFLLRVLRRSEGFCCIFITPTVWSWQCEDL
jgi:hypothetical protein